MSAQSSDSESEAGTSVVVTFLFFWKCLLAPLALDSPPLTTGLATHSRACTYIGARVYLKGLTLKKNQLGWSTPLVSNIVNKLILFVVYKQSSRILIGSDVSQRFSMRCLKSLYTHENLKQFI
jgi:hypothetical protein